LAAGAIFRIFNDTNVHVILVGITALEMAEGKPPYGDIHPMRVCIVLLSVILFMYLNGNCR